MPNKFDIYVKPTRAAVIFPHCLQVIAQILLSRFSQTYVLELLIQSCHNGLQLFIALDQQFQLTATRAGHKSNKVHAMSKFDVLMNITHLRNMKCATCRNKPSFRKRRVILDNFVHRIQFLIDLTVKLHQVIHSDESGVTVKELKRSTKIRQT